MNKMLTFLYVNFIYLSRNLIFNDLLIIIIKIELSHRSMRMTGKEFCLRATCNNVICPSQMASLIEIGRRAPDPPIRGGGETKCI